MRKENQHYSIEVEGVNVVILISSSFPTVIKKFAVLSAFVNKLSLREQEVIMNGTASTCQIRMKYGIPDRYYMLFKPIALTNHQYVAHEAFHLALRILGRTKIMAQEEKYAYLIQQIYEKIIIVFNQHKKNENSRT